MTILTSSLNTDKLFGYEHEFNEFKNSFDNNNFPSRVLLYGKKGIGKFINAKTLQFLSIEGLYKSMGYEKINSAYPQFTDHYFTGEYPIKPVDHIRDNKITQLSLLSGKSSN